ncbi:plant-specific TFIIB-related protein PTF2 [Iris pallida]|uniref:Plant-specific TFIIB-related protein PTF2 n=1 Tax=Iris pallida TaxID=29817 RepID=A0AAX6E4J8_IRIPA|nr:plant-specific TFIIB-related protein PTF2 [Iris pallida]
MLSRVLRFLDDGGGGGGESSSHLPHFDTAFALSRTFKTLPAFSSSCLDSNKVEQMASMGQFLIRCAGKWFLSTGRRPMPLVAAVAAFVAEVNGVEVPLEEIAKGIHAVVSTSRLRLRELKEALVRVARNLLPWGQDVDTKNLTQNAPLLIRLIQVKASRSKSVDKTVASTEDFLDFDLDGTFDMCSGSEEVGCNYFKVKAVEEQGLEERSWDELKTIKFSEVSFSDAYKNVLERIDSLRESGGLRSNGERTKKTRREEGLEADAWMDSCAWSWDSDKNLTLKEILERDVGYDALPPSFVNGIESRARRKEKIIAAKVRINQTMNPRVKSDSGPRVEEEECLLKPVGPRKRKMRKRKGVGADGIDWEDCIIELLLLHQVDEEEIEQGQYNRLLDLHVFNSLST